MVLNYSVVTSMVLRSPVRLLAPSGMSTGMNACEQVTGYNPAFWSLSVESDAANEKLAAIFSRGLLIPRRTTKERAKETLDKYKITSGGRFSGTDRTQ